jgi:hypothetical protein
VIVNQTTIINKTVNITKVQVVNKTVINVGPRTENIERATGRQIRPVPVNQLRHQQEAAVVARQPKVKALQQARAARKPIGVGAKPGTEHQTATQVGKAQRTESGHAQKEQREQATEQERRQKAQASEKRQEQNQEKSGAQKQEKQQTDAERKAAAKKKKKPQEKEEGHPKEQPLAP